MASRKSILDIAWNVPEETYRSDPSYHYSLLSDFRNKGVHFASELLNPPEERKPSKSLIFGSLVDAMLTDESKLEQFENIGREEDVVKLTATEQKVATYILENQDYFPLQLLKTDDAIFFQCFLDCEAYATSRPQTVLDKHGNRILDYLEKTIGKTSDKYQVTEEDWVDALECKAAILESSMGKYFTALPFDGDVERVNQLKLKWRDPRTGITYRVMLDNVYVDHNSKIIQPNDVKTSSSYEDEFYNSFLKWNYDIQARLYWRVLYNIIKDDLYFKDFTILPFQFLVVSRYSKTPIIWRYDDCVKPGELVYHRRNGSVIVLDDPFDIGLKLQKAADRSRAIQEGISVSSSNPIEYWIENGS